VAIAIAHSTIGTSSHGHGVEPRLSSVTRTISDCASGRHGASLT